MRLLLALTLVLSCARAVAAVPAADAAWAKGDYRTAFAQAIEPAISGHLGRALARRLVEAAAGSVGVAAGNVASRLKVSVLAGRIAAPGFSSAATKTAACAASITAGSST